jgi:hypothetical protein
MTEEQDAIIVRHQAWIGRSLESYRLAADRNGLSDEELAVVNGSCSSKKPSHRAIGSKPCASRSNAGCS